MDAARKLSDDTAQAVLDEHRRATDIEAYNQRQIEYVFKDALDYRVVPECCDWRVTKDQLFTEYDRSRRDYKQHNRVMAARRERDSRFMENLTKIRAAIDEERNNT